MVRDSDGQRIWNGKIMKLHWSVLEVKWEERKNRMGEEVTENKMGNFL